ncbi:molybdopterin-dependent oxidoreductase [Rhizobium sp. P38BS-XIX]|uniref:xanthine dehydrogenase family protein molybdopterin-binding subunit n=1 Tax=Rhizobium sp. P38BS-XIX TaxID=2726740 RepID=UPI001456A954|nr:molybdopterin cofactor-binding domain-containing protein [Rhizobium sp. P38BS-XIX]NLS01725.1 molybdopterin-dependent oxidoreductase [Rhizobium sp. P38BS-XIX]
MNGATGTLTRRAFGIGFGALVATFSLAPRGIAQVVEGAAPQSFAKTKRLDGWIRVSADNIVTVFTGKAELGQGILTALAQIAADELDVEMAQIRMISADTSRGPDEGYTYGSQSIEQSGSALRAAAAQARAVLVAAAAQRLNVPPSTLAVDSGVIRQIPSGPHISYGEIAVSEINLLDRDVSAGSQAKAKQDYRLVGHTVARIDLPGKILAKGVYLQDMRLPGMVFGRIVRPPSPGATLENVDDHDVRQQPGIVAVVRIESFLGVVAEREEQAIAAAETLRAAARWRKGPALLDEDHLVEELRALPREDILVSAAGQEAPLTPVRTWVEASYSRPYLSQGSIGPSCAVACFADGHMTVWSHTQGAFPLRGDMATVLELPSKSIDVIHVQAAGCYGHNGADDAAMDAALLARAVEGRPVKLQWMRGDEFAWSPISPAMSMKVKAGLSPEGKIVDWTYDVWGNSHATRPGQPGGVNLLASWYIGKGYHVSPPLKIPQPFGNGDRNAVPYYDLARRKISHHLLTEMPIRTGSLRTLGGQANIYAIECFMDELAASAGIDPVEFRLNHLSDPRGRAVIEATAKAAGWQEGWKSDGTTGRGFAYARYKNISTFAAVAVEVKLDRASGAVAILSVHAAVDVGLVINPDGVKSQSEGGIVQGLSWALKEQMRFDREKITSVDWAGYPILTFEEVPPINVIVIDRPDDPSLGAGEGTVGPASAALANAIANAAGVRIRDLPLTPEKIKTALG